MMDNEVRSSFDANTATSEFHSIGRARSTSQATVEVEGSAGQRRYWRKQGLENLARCNLFFRSPARRRGRPYPDPSKLENSCPFDTRTDFQGSRLRSSSALERAQRHEGPPVVLRCSR